MQSLANGKVLVFEEAIPILSSERDIAKAIVNHICFEPQPEQALQLTQSA